MDSMRESLLLLNSCGCFDARILDSLKALGISPEDAAAALPSAMARLGVSDASREILAERAAGGWAKSEMKRCERSGVRLLFHTDNDFLEILKNTPDPPLVLYVRGKGLQGGESAAVVGTRKCSSYGAHVAETLGSSLAAADICVVSGGARGIDGAAHGGCLGSGGRTVAVLGTGVDIAYPGNHRRLFEDIMQDGALLSEYPLGTSGLPWRFPRRNRIIAGLCSRCVVVEAPIQSGAITTARLALEAGREVWAVPGRITDSACEGSNALISDGAVPLVDIAEFVGIASGAQIDLFATDRARAGFCVPSLSDEESAVLGILSARGDMTVDNIASEGKMSAAAVLRVIGVLSAYGLVFISGPGRWSAGVSSNRG